MKIKFKVRLAMAFRSFCDPYSFDKNRANTEITEVEVERALDEAITYGKVRVNLPTDQRACEAIGATP